LAFNKLHHSSIFQLPNPVWAKPKTLGDTLPSIFFKLVFEWLMVEIVVNTTTIQQLNTSAIQQF